MKPRFPNLALVVVLLIAGCSRRAEYYVATGKALAAKGKAADAILNYRKALQKDPGYGPAYLQLGITQARDGQARAALTAFTRAAALAPKETEPKIRLADLCLALYLLDVAHSEPRLYQTISTMTSELGALQPSAFDTLRLKGMLAIMDQHPSDAVPLLRRAAAMRSDDHNVQLALIHALSLSGQAKEAASLSMQLIEKDKTFQEIYDELYDLALRGNDTAEGERIRELDIRNNPQSPSALLSLADHYYRFQNHAALDRTLERLASGKPDIPDGSLLAGQFLSSRREFKTAQVYLVDGARTHPGDVRYGRLLALALNAQGKKMEAIGILSGLIKNKASDTGLRALRASMLVENDDPADIGRARSEFESLLKEKPDDNEALYGLGRALFRQGQYSDASANFRKLLGKVSDPTLVRLALAEVSMASGDAASALESATAARDRQPTNALARLVHARALVFSGQSADGISELRTLERDRPGSEDVLIELGRAYLAAGRLIQAEAVFRKLYKPGESNVGVVQGLSSVALAQGKPSEAISIWESEIGRSRDPVMARRNLADVAFLARRYDVAIRELNQIVAAVPTDAAAWEGLARAYHLSGDFNRAMDAGRKACDFVPDSVIFRAELAQILSAVGQPNESAIEYRKALRKDPSNPVLLNDLAYELAQSGTGLDEAERLVTQAIRARPTENQLHDTLALVYIKANKADAAISVLRPLILKEPDRAEFRYHLGMALAQKGLARDAQMEWNEALRRDPSSPEREAILAALKLKNSN